MRTYLLFGVFWFLTSNSFCQTRLQLYNDLINKGDSLYELKLYKDAATIYSRGVKVLGNKARAFDRSDAIYSWMRLNVYDSAIYQLEQLANSEILTFTEVDQVTAHKLVNPLRSDTRWEPILDKLYERAYKNYLVQYKEDGKKLPDLIQKQKDLVLALRKNDAQAFNQINDKAYVFLKKKQYDRAYKFFRLSLDHFGPNAILYQNMMDYYLAINDKDRAYVYFSRARVIKYKQRAFVSVLNTDSVLKADYRALSGLLGYEVFPPEYLVKMIAAAYLDSGMTMKAFGFIKMNLALYPTSYTTNKDMADYLSKIGNKREADAYYQKSLVLQYDLPDDFFHPLFNIEQYFVARTDSLSGTTGFKPIPPEGFVDDVAKQFLEQKMFDKAEKLFKLNTDNYPTSYYANKSMSAFYKILNNKVKEEFFDEQAQAAKEKYGTRRSRVFKDGPVADTTFDVSVSKPVCWSNCPTILVDYVHRVRTIATLEHDFKTLFKLLKNDGFNIVKNYDYLTRSSLAKTNVVFLKGGEFEQDEIKLLNKWVHDGGSLLTFTHHDWPLFDEVLQSFGIQTYEIEVTHDSLHGLLRDRFIENPTYIYFSLSDSLLGKHVIMNGENESAKIKRVQTFASKAIIGPPNSTNLLKLSDSAVDFMSIDIEDRTSRVPVKTPGNRSLGIAFTYGKGKVVVTDSWALMALLFEQSERGKMGMNTPGIDNKQYALNIMRWLTDYPK